MALLTGQPSQAELRAVRAGGRRARMGLGQAFGGDSNRFLTNQERAQDQLQGLMNRPADLSSVDGFRRFLELQVASAPREKQAAVLAAALPQLNELTKQQKLARQRENAASVVEKQFGPDAKTAFLNGVSLEQIRLTYAKPKSTPFYVVNSQDKVVKTLFKLDDLFYEPAELAKSKKTPFNLNTIQSGQRLVKNAPTAGVKINTDRAAEKRAEAEGQIEKEQFKSDLRIAEKTIASRQQRNQGLVDTATNDLSTSKAGNAIALRLDDLQKNMSTGRYQEAVSDVVGAYASVRETLGVNVDPLIRETVSTASEFNKIAIDYLKPFVEQQGRGFTDQERVFFLSTGPGLKNPWQYNALFSAGYKLAYQSDIEKNKLFNARNSISSGITSVKDFNENLKDASDLDFLYQQYLEDIPRSEVKTTTINVGGRDEQIDLQTFIPDNGANLWKYYVKKAPVGFKIKLKDKIQDLSISELKQVANVEQISMKNLMSQLENNRNIIDAIYE